MQAKPLHAQASPCQKRLSSGLVLFRVALLRAGAVQGCSPQGWSCSGLLSSGLVLFRAALLRAVGLQVAAIREPFGKPFGTANCSVQEPFGKQFGKVNGSIWEAIWESKWQHLMRYLGLQMAAFRTANLLKYRALDWN